MLRICGYGGDGEIKTFYDDKLSTFHEIYYKDKLYDSNHVYDDFMMDETQPDYTTVSHWLENKKTVLTVLRLLWNTNFAYYRDTIVRWWKSICGRDITTDEPTFCSRYTLSILHTWWGRMAVEGLWEKQQDDSIFMKCIALPVCNEVAVVAFMLFKLFGKTLALEMFAQDREELRRVEELMGGVNGRGGGNVYHVQLYSKISRIALWESLGGRVGAFKTFCVMMDGGFFNDVYTGKQLQTILCGDIGENEGEDLRLKIYEALCVCPIVEVSDIWSKRDGCKMVSFSPAVIDGLEYPTYCNWFDLSTGLQLNFTTILSQLKRLYRSVITDEEFKWTVEAIGEAVPFVENCSIENVVEFIDRFIFLRRMRVLRIQNNVLCINVGRSDCTLDINDKYRDLYLRHPLLAFTFSDPPVVCPLYGDKACYIGEDAMQMTDCLKAQCCTCFPEPIFGPTGRVKRRKAIESPIKATIVYPLGND